MKVIPRVLIFLTNEDKILLLKGSKQKRNWPSLYNGIGGHVEAGENIREAANRELNEEAGIRPVDLWLCAIVNIEADKEQASVLMFVLRGEIEAHDSFKSAEGETKWLPQDGIHDLDLVEDLYTLLPRILDRSAEQPPLWGRYWTDKEGNFQSHFS